MVPVNSGTYSTLLDTSTATSSAMLLPRGNLNSQSRGDQHEIFSARAAGKLDQPGICHEGPTTYYKVEHGEAKSAQHRQGGGKVASGAPGQTPRAL